ncbi:MAG: ribosome biogenesis GTP-binding protein YihA/YsxC [Bacilli bacterium]|nr:ribosome biogenesis GTP-binding protein YihA/YsxC [Bacilli bacterium]
MIDFAKATFIKSAPTLKDRPETSLNEICFIGKSNVGKSSLINALVKRRNLAHTSSKPGYTKLLNYYLIDDKFYLVDAPGYGYTASGSKHLDNFSKMMETYFDNKNLKGVVFLVDSRHKMSEDDKLFYSFILDKGIPFVLVATKVDKLNQSEKAKMKKNVKEVFGDIEFIPTSKDDNRSIDKIKETIVRLVLG